MLATSQITVSNSQTPDINDTTTVMADTVSIDTTSTGVVTIDTTKSKIISYGEAAPAPAPVPTDWGTPMQATVTRQGRKTLPTQADDTTGDTAPDAVAGSATDIAVEKLDDIFDIATVTAPPPPVPALEPPTPPEFEPASLLGASSSKIEAVLGSADLLRREGTAEVWQYRLATCVVDYFVYPDANGNKQVTGWDWRPPIIAENLNAQQCRQDLAARQVTSDL